MKGGNVYGTEILIVYQSTVISKYYIPADKGILQILQDGLVRIQLLQ